MAEKNVRFVTKELLVAESLAEAAVPLFDGGPLTTEKRTSPLMLAMPAVLTLALHRASTACASGLLKKS